MCLNWTLLVGIGLGGLALVLNIIGTALPYWAVTQFGNAGLFQSCSKWIIAFGLATCVPLDPAVLPSWWKVTQGLMLLSIFVMGAGVVVAILFGYVFKDKQVLAIVAAFLTFYGAALVLTGVIIFGVKTVETTRSRYQVGFGLVISSTIFAVQASVMMIISKGRNTPPGATPQEGIT